MKSSQPTKSSKPLVVGARVKTIGDTKLVSAGTVVTISTCGRYAIVAKQYGEHIRLRRHYYVEDLKVL